ncbi:FecR family protein [Marinifilum sp. RC60d5]|uniref:FecR family protein n=1 Tax=Marinifilum sp. RC60d5 TaxID=3458414 RepID=UPI0040374EDB
MTKETSHNIEWENISKYLNGEMNKDEKISFEKLIDSNSEYAKIVAASEKDLDLVEQVYKISNDFDTENAWHKVKSRIEHKQLIEKKSTPNIKLNKLMQIAAMLAIVIGFSIFSYKGYHKYFSTQITFVSEFQESGQKIILPDGSSVSLNGKSKLTYPRKFTNKERKVSLSGEAFFDIVKNPSKPFIIIAENAEIKVLGTSFNVVAKENKVEVLVESGKVQFKGIQNPTNSLVLEKGDFGILSENHLQKSILKDENYLSWKTHRMIFKEMELKEVAKVIERTYRVSIKFDNDSIAKNHINTAFDNDPLNRVLNNICLSYNLIYKKNGNQIIIKSRN